LFIGHPDAGQRSAILYSLIVSCQRHGKDPMAYMKDLIARLPRMTNRDDLRALTPRLWRLLRCSPISLVTTATIVVVIIAISGGFFRNSQ